MSFPLSIFCYNYKSVMENIEFLSIFFIKYEINVYSFLVTKL